jgi:transketolase
MRPESRAIRELILRSSLASGHGHVPSSFSVVELILAVYTVMRHDPSNPAWPQRDLFLLSKGHAAFGYYSVLAHLGYFGPEQVATTGNYGSPLGCHPDRLKVPGVEASCGSLGHGIGLAVGMALGIRLRSEKRSVYVLVGDGEANEGSFWEAVMVASEQRLSNLTILYDHNNSQSRCLQIRNPAERLSAFGCMAHEVSGHDIAAITEALKYPADNVKAIVGHTVKGYGCPTLVNNVYAWHRRSPNEEELRILLEELNAQAI